MSLETSLARVNNATFDTPELKQQAVTAIYDHFGVKEPKSSPTNVPSLPFSSGTGEVTLPPPMTADQKQQAEQFGSGLTKGLANTATFGLVPFGMRALKLIPPDLRTALQIPEAEKQGTRFGNMAGNALTATIPSIAFGPTKTIAGTFLRGVPGSMVKGAGIGFASGFAQTPEEAQKSGKLEDFVDLKGRVDTGAFNAMLGAGTSGITKALGNAVSWFRNKAWAGGDLKLAEAERKVIQDQANNSMTAEYKNYGKQLDLIDKYSEKVKNPPVVNNKELLDDVQSELGESSAAFKNFLKNNKLTAGKGDNQIIDIGKTAMNYKDARNLLSKLQRDSAVKSIYNKIDSKGFGVLNNPQREIFFFVEGMRKNINNAAAESTPKIAKMVKEMNERYGKIADAYKHIYPIISDSPIPAMGSGDITGMSKNPDPRMMVRAQRIFTPEQLKDMESYRLFIQNNRGMTDKSEIGKTLLATGMTPALYGALKFKQMKDKQNGGN